MATKTVTLFATLAATIAASTVAYADPTPVPAVPFTTTAKWNVAMDPNQGGGCYAETSYDGTNTVLRLGYNPSTQQAYVSIRNQSWSDFVLNQAYAVSVSLNNAPPIMWTGFGGPLSDGGTSLYFGNLSRAALGSFAAASVVDIRYRGMPVLRGALVESGLAVQKIGECEVAFGASGGPFRATAPARRADPFKML